MNIGTYLKYQAVSYILSPPDPQQTNLTNSNPQAASGIGKETGLAFAEAGVRAVVFADLNETGAQTAADKSSKLATNSQYRALAVKVDVTSEESVQRMVDTTLDELERV